jgi:hypothetical protein
MLTLFSPEIAAWAQAFSSMSMADIILLRHSVSRHQILSVKLCDAHHGCVSSHY